MNKNFDCVKMKNDLQEILYNKLNPVDFNDYYEKMNTRIKNNKFYKKLKNKLNKKIELENVIQQQ